MENENSSFVMNNPENFNPVEAILEEIEKARRAGKKEGILTLKLANDWIDDAAKRPKPKSYFHDTIVQFENTVLFASANVGKSILAVQIAEDIAMTETVYYVDLELSDKQFQLRYSDSDTGELHIFPDFFYRAEIDPELIGGVDLEQEILDSIELAAMKGIKFIVIDNLTFICPDAEKSKEASEFMMKLIRLKKKYELTTIVIAHTPKRRGYEPITHNDLAGSSKLISFFDAGIALARSAMDNNIRYLKQVKVRTGEFKYDGDNVIVMDLVKSHGYLHFEVQGYANEDKHLKKGNPDDIEEIYDILLLRKQKMSLRDIATHLGISLAKVQRRLKKAEDENITLPSEDSDGVSNVSIVSDDDTSIQPIHNTANSASIDEEEDRYEL